MTTPLGEPYGYGIEERRGERRRRVLFFGRIADETGATLTDCAITNLSSTGAQVRLYAARTLPRLVYLIDPKTHAAHLSQVVWRRDDRLGLHFHNTFDLDKELDERLHFLKTLLIETKLKQVELLETKGFSLEQALEAIGATRTTYDRWRREELLHEETRTTMDRLIVENTQLLRTLAAQQSE
jgi:hypothetical protein